MISLAAVSRVEAPCSRDVKCQTPHAPDEDDAGVWGCVATITTFPTACRPPSGCAAQRATMGAPAGSSTASVVTAAPQQVSAEGRKGHVARALHREPTSNVAQG